MSENTVFDSFSEFSEEGADNVRAVEYISDEGEGLTRRSREILRLRVLPPHALLKRAR